MLCSAGNYLAVRDFVDVGNATMNLVDLGTLSVVQRWTFPCPHYSSDSPLPMVGYSMGGTHFVLEGCAACEWLRIHNVHYRTIYQAYPGSIQTRLICTGPAQTIFVLDGGTQNILQLSPDQVPNDHSYVTFSHVLKEIKFNMEIVGMKYFDSSDVIVLAAARPPKVMGIKTSARGYKILWQCVDQLGDIPLNPIDVAIMHPNELACIANTDSVLVVNPSDGSIVFYRLLDEDKVQGIEWCNDNLVTLQIDGLISVHKIAL